MNRNHAISLVIGLMLGFVIGYMAFEEMALRQPERRPAPDLSGSQGAAVARPAPSGGGSVLGTAPRADSPAMGGMEQVQRLRQYVEENPEDTSALRVLANLNYDIQNWSRAAELYGRLLELEPDNHDVRTELGITYRNMQRPAEALQQFRRITTEDPANWQARYNEVLVLTLDLEDHAAAAELLDPLVALQPENPQVVELAAEVRRRNGG